MKETLTVALEGEAVTLAKFVRAVQTTLRNADTCHTYDEPLPSEASHFGVSVAKPEAAQPALTLKEKAK